MRREDLFVPSLQGHSGDLPYSKLASFMVAFFGGPFAAIGFAFLNGNRTGNVDKNRLPVALVLTVAYFAGLTWALSTEVLTLDRQMVRLLSRVVAVAVWAWLTMPLRRIYRAAELSPEDWPSPWKAGILTIIGAAVVQAFVVVVLRAGFGG
ncbi:MAG: hypothetical protein ACE37F_07665 [Nannocystaceae bacterium]|nr:hypothetical protein [bacterium]